MSKDHVTAGVHQAAPVTAPASASAEAALALALGDPMAGQTCVSDHAVVGAGGTRSGSVHTRGGVTPNP